MSCVVTTLRYNDSLYLFTLYPEVDDRVDVTCPEEDEEKVLLTFTANCGIVKDDKVVGRISSRKSSVSERSFWTYEFYQNDPKAKVEGVMTAYDLNVCESIFGAERDAFRTWMEKEKLKA
jgi:hypothetical protein